MGHSTVQAACYQVEDKERVQLRWGLRAESKIGPRNLFTVEGFLLMVVFWKGKKQLHSVTPQRRRCITCGLIREVVNRRPKGHHSTALQRGKGRFRNPKRLKTSALQSTKDDTRQLLIHALVRCRHCCEPSVQGQIPLHMGPNSIPQIFGKLSQGQLVMLRVGKVSFLQL